MQPSNSKKLKKRKTRKCLDELRKRRRQINNDNKLQKKHSCCPRKCVCITNNRLSLCNKAIRSKTVTRSQLSESVNINCKELHEIKAISRGETKDNKEQAKSYIKCDNNEIEDLNTSNIHKQSKNRTPESIISLNVGSLDENVNNEEIEEPYNISQISLNNVSNNTYEDDLNNFAGDLDDYIEQTLPQVLLKLNFLKIEENLMSLLESSPDSNDDTYLKEYHMLISKNECMEHTEQNLTNTLDYSESKLNIQDVSESDSTTIDSVKSHDIQSSSPVDSLLYDSPEYNYYPNKLN